MLALRRRVHPARRGEPDLTSPVRYPWLLFDADDTLFDFRSAEAAALRRSFEDAGVACEPAWIARYREVNAAAWRELEAGRITSARLRVARFERLFAEIGCALDPGSVGERYLRHLAGQSPLVDGALELLDAVRARHRIVIVTNGIAAVQRSRLARSPIAPWVSDIVISEELGVAKPDPAYFDIVVERLGRPSRQDLLVVGDSLTSDIAGGRAAGADTCWFNPQGRSRGDAPAPTHEIRRLAELLPILQG